MRTYGVTGGANVGVGVAEGFGVGVAVLGTVVGLVVFVGNGSEVAVAGAMVSVGIGTAFPPLEIALIKMTARMMTASAPIP